MKLENKKLLLLNEAVEIRKQLKNEGKSVVLTNGCFDLLHTGHLYFLKEASSQGQSLWVALNGDASVRQLKGPLRPIQDEIQRAYALAALGFIDGVFVFQSERLTEEILTFQPDKYVKAGDYDIDSINREERNALEAIKAEIKFLPFLEGFSTTKLIQKIKKAL